METETVPHVAWQSLTDFIKEWFYEPDIEALDIVLTTAASHYWVQADPLWLFVIGPASTGKTSMLINSCAGLPGSVVMGDMGVDTLLSAYGKQRDHGVMSRHPNPILLFKDFTTMIAKRPEYRHEIQGQLREIYDGQYNKHRGVGGVFWKGKATCIAACTPALDREWGLQRDLGERFLSLRLQAPDPIQSALVSMKQRGHETEIKNGMQELALAYVDPSTLKAPEAQLTEAQQTEIAYLSQFVAWMRSHVIRESDNHRTITSVSEPESPTRCFKALSLLCLFASSVHRTKDCNTSFARRIAYQSVPTSRMKIVSNVPPGSSATPESIAKQGNMIIRTVRWQCEELEAMGILRSKSNPTEYEFTDSMNKVLSGFNFYGF